jgi:hypothetical protein
MASKPTLIDQLQAALRSESFFSEIKDECATVLDCIHEIEKLCGVESKADARFLLMEALRLTYG